MTIIHLDNSTNMHQTQWQDLPIGATAIADAPIIITPPQWQDLREGEIGANTLLALRIAPDTDLAALSEDFQYFSMILLEFPSFTDGRAYSQARQLRQRWKYSGELRGFGNILRDQIGFIRRVGIQSIESDDPRLINHWQESDANIKTSYQKGAIAGELLTRQAGP